MKKYIKKIIYNIRFPKIFYKNIILMESYPDFSDSSKYLYEEIIRRKLNNKYKIVWLINENAADYIGKIKEKNVYFLNNNEKNFIKKIRLSIIKIFSKYIVDSNKYIQKSNVKQIRIFLTHGMPIKLPYDYCGKCGDVDYLTVTSEFFVDISSKLYNIPKNRIVVTGLPRNDALHSEEKNILFPEIVRKKTILWMPTYRNHKLVDSYAARTGIKLKYGVPCIDSENQLNKLNKILIDNNILLLIKYHHSDDVLIDDETKISNIKFFDDSYLKSTNKTIYDYLKDVDALITDYSSIYYDYLLTDNSIGLTISDLDVFSKHLKLINNDYKKYIKGFYINTFDDLVKFVKFTYKSNELENAKKMFHKYSDDKSSSRVCDILEKEMEKK